jgi:hypothetical protein
VRPAFVTETLQFETKYCSQAIAFYSFKVQSHGSSVDDVLIYINQVFFSRSQKNTGGHGYYWLPEILEQIRSEIFQTKFKIHPKFIKILQI